MDAISRLRHVDFMSQLRESQIRALASICRAQTFVQGEPIVHQGDMTNSFFIVDEGHVHFRETDTEGLEMPAGAAGPGEYFGKPMFASQEPSQYSAEALGRARLYVMTREDFDGLLQKHPTILQELPEIARERQKLTRGFKWLTPGEIVALTTHHHNVNLLTLVLPPLGIGIVLIGVVLVIGSFGVLGGNLPLLISAVVGALALAVAIFAGFDWADDDFIVTNKRVVHVEKVLLFAEERDEIPINKIQSIVTAKRGFFDNLFGISSLEITSAGREESHIVFDMIANAEKVKQLILKQQQLLRAREMALQREKFRGLVRGELRHYVLKEATQDPEAETTTTTVLQTRLRRRRLRSWWQNWFGYVIRNGDTVTWRKHWVALFHQVRLWLIPLLGSLILLGIYLAVPWPSEISRVGFLGVIFVVFIAGLGGFLWQWDDWRNDLYQVDDRQVTDIERLPFGFNERSTVALLRNVQDVTLKRPHWWNAILNYGNVIVQVAGAGEPLTFYNVPRPQEIVEEIFRRIEAFRIRQQERETRVQSREIVDALVAYHRLLMTERHGESAGALPAPGASGAAGQLPPGGAAPPPGAGEMETEIGSTGSVSQSDEPAESEFPPSSEIEGADLYEDNI